MTTLDLGNIRLNWRGAYDETSEYVRDDAVSYRGSSFIAKRNITGITPIAGDDWDILAAGTDQLTTQGDVLTHDGNTPVRLPRGDDGQILQVIDNQPTWCNQGLHPSQRVKQLAQVNRYGGWCTRVYLMTDGTLKACGCGTGNSNGDPLEKHLYLPSRVTTQDPEVRLKEVYSGNLQHYALTETGEVWSWGRNQYGQLGHGDTQNRAIATRIDYFPQHNIRISKVIPGRATHNEESCAYFLTTDGRVYACGRNAQGNLGNGTTVDQLLPVRCGSLTNIVDVFVSSLPYSAYAIDTSGQLWVWGWNECGQLGLDDKLNRDVPLPHPLIDDAITACITCGYQNDGKTPKGHGLVIRQGGVLWSTGYNEHGQLGVGDKVQRTSFVEIPTDAAFTHVASGDGRYGNCAAISDTGDAYFWGANSYGLCGLAHGEPVLSPTKPDAVFQGNVTKVCFGGGSGLEGVIVQAGNQLWGAGYSKQGSLGTGSTAEVNNTFQPVVGISGDIQAWHCFGDGNSHWGLGVLYTDGRVDACGQHTEIGETGTQSANLHLQPVLKNVIFG